jgi:hypothetical protein
VKRKLQITTCGLMTVDIVRRFGWSFDARVFSNGSPMALLASLIIFTCT